MRDRRALHYMRPQASNTWDNLRNMYAWHASHPSNQRSRWVNTCCSQHVESHDVGHVNSHLASVLTPDIPRLTSMISLWHVVFLMSVNNGKPVWDSTFWLFDPYMYLTWPFNTECKLHDYASIYSRQSGRLHSTLTCTANAWTPLNKCKAIDVV